MAQFRFKVTQIIKRYGEVTIEAPTAQEASAKAEVWDFEFDNAKIVDTSEDFEVDNDPID